MRRAILSAFVRVSLLLLTVGFAMQAAGTKHKAVLVPLEKTEWKLVWLGATKIELATPQQMAYFQLDPENHRVSGSGGCNRLMGGYELNGNNLKFTQMAMTRMACIHGGDTESAFTAALDLVKEWKMSKGKLLLLDADHRVLAKFLPYTPEAGSGM